MAINPNRAGKQVIGDGGPEGVTLSESATDLAGMHGSASIKESVSGDTNANEALETLLVVLENKGIIINDT